MNSSKDKIVTILGTTATGKTGLAVNLAYAMDAEIISADSRQVYRGMDLGTGKDLDEYIVHDKQIPYHLIDIHNAGYEYNVFEYQKDFFDCYEKLKSQNKNIILCGGTGLYLESVLQSYEFRQVPQNKELREELEQRDIESLIEQLKRYGGELHNTTDTSSKKRCIRAIEIAEYTKEHPVAEQQYPEISSLNFGIRFPRETIRERITFRLKERLEHGMIEEVQHLLDKGTTHEQLEFYGLEYRYVSRYLTGNMNYNDMFRKLNTSIHQFAKRQETWWRRMEKKGIEIHWIDGGLSLPQKLKVIEEILNKTA